MQTYLPFHHANLHGIYILFCFNYSQTNEETRYDHSDLFVFRVITVAFNLKLFEMLYAIKGFF